MQDTKKRFTASNPCPICGGYDEAARGKGVRCYGFRSGNFVHCTRADKSGGLPLNPSSDTFPHRLRGDCNCGVRHDTRPPSVKQRQRKSRPKTLVDTYDYLDADSVLQYQAIRYSFDDNGEKTFLQRRPDGNGGSHWNLKGVTRLPFLLPELLATPLDSIVFICEGEKDVLKLRSDGLAATCNSEGAGKFHPDLVKWFKGRHVVILGDNDEAGRNHALDVAGKLHGIAASVKLLDFETMPEHSDVSDWLDAGNDIEALLIEADACVEFQPTPFNFSSDDAETDDSPLAFPFPESAFRGIFGDFRDLMGPTTEASDVFHYWMCALMFGATLGRQLSVIHAGELFPNFYVVLVGTSGWARKDTAWNRAEMLLDALHADDDREHPQLRLIYGAASVEGLLKIAAGSKATVLRQAEFASLLRKGKQEATSNLLPQLTQAYDCPQRIQSPTKNDPITWNNPFLSIAAGSTKEWLQKHLQESDIKGGFGNRFIFALGERKGPMAYPPDVRKAPLDALNKSIVGVRAWANSLDQSQRQLKVTEDAKDLFAEWYAPFYIQASGDGIIPSLAVRMQDFAWKLALLYAAWDKSLEITLDHLMPALSVVNYQRETNRTIFGDYSGTNRELESRITEILEASPGRVMTNRAMYRKLKISSGRLMAIYKPLSEVGVVRQTEIEGKSSHILLG